MRNRLINRIFESPLGKVVCGLDASTSSIESIEKNKYQNGHSETFNVGGYKIELVEFKIKQLLYNGGTVANSHGWIWRIEKKEDLNVELNLFCELTNYPEGIDFDIASGEHIDAIEVKNNNWTLHIGTEDGEVMNSRAETNDWFPNRFQNKVDFYQSITQMNKEGFVTEIPNLKVGEVLHIQFLTAYDKSNSDTVNTWLAVDESKRKLENWIGFS